LALGLHGITSVAMRLNMTRTPSRDSTNAGMIEESEPSTGVRAT
jgi:hypothetical protein